MTMKFEMKKEESLKQNGVLILQLLCMSAGEGVSVQTGRFYEG